MDVEVRQRTYDSFSRLVELPMLVLALLMVPLLLVPEFFELSPELKETFFVLDAFIWAAFALELVIKTYLSEKRGDYLIRHWFDLIIVVVPFLRPLRIFRSVRLLRLMRGARLLSFALRFVHSARTLIDQHGIKYALVAGALLFFAAAGLALLFERDQGNIRTMDDALWWAATTITTVGYGDRYPVTTEGRAIAVFLMFLGISLFSLITASVAALFVLPEQKKEEATLEDVLQRLADLEALLIAQRDGMAPTANGDSAHLPTVSAPSDGERARNIVHEIDAPTS
jgi:voltage-gated potassium channel